jgi:hypothetical protein
MKRYSEIMELRIESPKNSSLSLFEILLKLLCVKASSIRASSWNV